MIAIMTQIRKTIAAPVILITESISEVVEVDLYKAGADLVLTRPYRLRVLQAQAHNLAIRGRSVPLSQLPHIRFNNIRVDPSTRNVQIGDLPAHPLTPREFELFYLLYTHQGQVIATDRIIDAIWGYTGKGDQKAVYSLTNRLREKIEPEPGVPRYIITVPRVGLQFVMPV